MILARSAQGLYWMSRYLERSEFIARLLELQTRALVDRPLSEIHFGWRRIYGSLGASPPAGDLEPDHSEDYALADSYTLAGDLTFERSNPNSMRSCFAAGRENARQMRHCISSGMWTNLNLAWLDIKDLDIQDIWAREPEAFYARMARTIKTFDGFAAATMYRDEGWQFLQLGVFIERIQLTAALVTTHCRVPEGAGDHEWTSLLRACQALDAFERVHGMERKPERILALVITDPLLQGSLLGSLTSAESCLDALGDEAGSPETAAAARRLAGRMKARVVYDWPDSTDRLQLLDETARDARDLHSLVTGAWFEYAIGKERA